MSIREACQTLVAPWLRATDVLVTELFVTPGVPAHLRCDNGPEFMARHVRRWLAARDKQTLFIEPERSRQYQSAG